LVTDSGHHLFKIKNIAGIGQSVEPKRALFGGVDAPVWAVVFCENGGLRNIRIGAADFVQEIDFINKSITSFGTATKRIPLYFSPTDSARVMIMHNA
jgi:hypothetical protein